jgi:DNA-binding MarR family transcriptional regulator
VDLFACAHTLPNACARIEYGATLDGVSVQTRSSSPAEIAAQCPTDSPLNGPGGEAWFGLLHTYAALVRKIDGELAAQHRLSLSAFELLVRLSSAPQDGSLSVTELARQVVISPSRVSRVVDELGRGGYVERRACSTDARVSYVAITEAGRDLLADASSTFDDAIRRHFLEPLDDAEVAQLGAIWEKLLSQQR